jgi:light-regulated signal transduction histidine kinase (bacteriophytochrome)
VNAAIVMVTSCGTLRIELVQNKKGIPRLVKHIVEAHQGKIDVRSALGHGSEFTAILPI